MDNQYETVIAWVNKVLPTDNAYDINLTTKQFFDWLDQAGYELIKTETLNELMDKVSESIAMFKELVDEMERIEALWNGAQSENT